MTEFQDDAHNSQNARWTASHWTDEQFSNYMIGLAVEPAAMQHLDVCAVCRAEAEQFQSSIESFNDLTLEWSERRPYARALVPEVKPGFGWLPTAAWAMAAAVVFSVGLPMALQHRAASVEDRPAMAQPGAAQVASIADENSAAAIARDNKLMMAVAYELDRTDPLPMDYGVAAPAGHKRQAGAGNE